VKKRPLISSCLLSCPPAWKNSAPTERIFIKFDIWVFLENLSRKFKFHYNLTKITGTLHEEQCKFVITYRSFLLWMSNVSDTICNGPHLYVFMPRWVGSNFMFMLVRAMELLEVRFQPSLHIFRFHCTFLVHFASLGEEETLTKAHGRLLQNTTVIFLIVQKWLV
jgi:hypothetical protein